MERNGDIIINGIGSSRGGVINKVLINGKGNISGDIDCIDFSINGTGKIEGDVKGVDGKINGSGSIYGTIEFEKFNIEGQGSISKNAFVQNLRISGKGDIGANIKGGEIVLRGKVSVDGDCEADIFRGEGNFNIGGLLNADLIKIKLHGESHAKEIGGQSIKVKQNSSFLNLFKPVFQNVLHAEMIEGDEIELENTQAKIVTGNNVTIGENCVIEKVEYKGTFTQAEGSIVKESIKI